MPSPLVEVTLPPMLGTLTSETVVSVVPPTNILMVDDQPANLIALEAILEGLGQRLVKARSGTEALARLLEDDFAVILLDVRMPDMDGYETAELIRSREKTRHTPIIFLTAYDRNEVAVSKGYALGAVDYLVKPFVPEILKAKVSVFVELYRKGERLRQLERAEFEHRLEEAHQRWETEHLRAEAEREKQRAAELADLDRRKNEFLAMLCHELRNPLAPLKNALKIMRLHKPVGEAVEQAHAIADRQLQQLGRLVEDLLDLSRIGSGKMRLEKQPTDLGKIVAHAVEVARPLIEARNHQLTVSVPTEPLPLEGDAARLEQVAVNLLTNAAKYTEPGGHIWVKAQRDGASLILSVRDNGIGLSADILPHLFDLFMQAESGSQGGLGIGLNLVRSLVRLHGGDVYAYSDGPGKGSEFVVRLPARLPGSG